MVPSLPRWQLCARLSVKDFRDGFWLAFGTSSRWVSSASKLNGIGFRETVATALRDRLSQGFRKGSEVGFRKPCRMGFARRFRSDSETVSEGLRWCGTGRCSSSEAACFREETPLGGRGLPLPVHLPVHLPEALPALEGDCWLWDVGVCVCPTATSGCRVFHSASSFHPRLFCVSA